MSYTSIEKTIGTPDLSAVSVASALGAPGIGMLPSVPMDPQLGTIINGRDASLGDGKFIRLAIPVSTTTTIGLLYQWDKNYTIVVVPVNPTSKNTGVQVAAAISTVPSNASSVQYAWFQIEGQATVLKTAVAISPQSKIYVSTTAGRIYATASAGAQILGARSGNTATISAAVSSVTVYLAGPSMIEGA